MASRGIRFRTTTRLDGDFAIDGEPAGLTPRRRAVVDLPWVWLRQVHGHEVVVVTGEDAAEVCGTEADALVTAEPGLVLAIQTADCVPVVLQGEHGVYGVAHAGWRGLEAGVIDATVVAMGAAGAGSIEAWIGPHIGPECYEFGAEELDRLATRFGDEVRGTTRSGTPALDLAALTRIELGRCGIEVVEVSGECTACQPERWYSHRARGETERMATLVWREP
jgi:YfiH family protein